MTTFYLPDPSSIQSEQPPTLGLLLQLADGSLQSCNSAAEDVLGLKAKHFQSWNIVGFPGSVLDATGRACLLDAQPAQITLKTGQPCSGVILAVCSAEQGWIWIQVDTEPLFRAQGTTPYAVISRFTKVSAPVNVGNLANLPKSQPLILPGWEPELQPAELEIHRLNHQLRQLVHVIQRLAAARDLPTIMTAIRRAARQLVGADGSTFVLREGDLCHYADEEAIAPLWKGQRFPMETCISGWVMLNNTSAVITDVFADPRIPTEVYRATFVKSLVMLPIQAIAPIGAIGVYWATHYLPSPEDVNLLQTLADAAAIAIQNVDLYQDLEQRVQDRTTQLQQSLEFEALLKRITDHVRDSLDEDQILRTVVTELGQGLNLQCCDTGIYNAEHTTATIICEFNQAFDSIEGLTFMIPSDTYGDVYNVLFRGETCQFCILALNLLRSENQQLAILACPIQDDQGILGDLWLFKPGHASFNDQELRLVQQVANQCAIALRQSRLYQAAQSQVVVLEQLNQLKDEFLSTVSHELRSPMANIKMVARMLGIALKVPPTTAAPAPDEIMLSSAQTQKIAQYLDVLNQECQRETHLIDDLLDLTRLDAKTTVLTPAQIQLQEWIPLVTQSFAERISQQRQQFQIQIPADLPPLITDIASLERIVAELVHNACKYTLPLETIRVVAAAHPTGITISVSNSGVEIPPDAQERIFDKFYRIPSHDPWKHGGTGLGLALIKKLVNLLQGKISVTSEHNWTEFSILLPYELAQPEHHD